MTSSMNEPESFVDFVDGIEDDKVAGVYFKISRVGPSRLLFQYPPDEHEGQQLFAQIQETPIGDKTLTVVSLERESRQGLSPIEVAELTRAGVEFLASEKE